MSDLISRQAAIDMFQRLAYDDWNQGASTTWANAYSEAVDMVRELPSAQPELLEHEAYIRGFEQGRTQGMIDEQERKK